MCMWLVNCLPGRRQEQYKVSPVVRTQLGGAASNNNSSTSITSTTAAPPHTALDMSAVTTTSATTTTSTPTTTTATTTTPTPTTTSAAVPTDYSSHSSDQTTTSDQSCWSSFKNCFDSGTAYISHKTGYAALRALFTESPLTPLGRWVRSFCVNTYYESVTYGTVWFGFWLTGELGGNYLYHGWDNDLFKTFELLYFGLAAIVGGNIALNAINLLLRRYTDGKKI